jgi:hypothetical protein
MRITDLLRNATETMMPRSVKNERSLFARISPNATLSRSVMRILGRQTTDGGRQVGRRTADDG